MYCCSQNTGQICLLHSLGSGEVCLALIYLNSLSMLLEDVHSHHSFVELWIQRLDNFIIEMLLKSKKQQHEVACVYDMIVTITAAKITLLPDTAEHQIL